VCPRIQRKHLKISLRRESVLVALPEFLSLIRSDIAYYLEEGQKPCSSKAQALWEYYNIKIKFKGLLGEYCVSFS
jgi:hypothetical protein